ncbi:MAG: ribbon-helix-helix protein, CopG family, partial [Cyanobacteria bacterium HKST-UBA02]|nr:ribbon-helix-helix protein, CopG family [Cyanobacteria bacterium HKST-UBA02]
MSKKRVWLPVSVSLMVADLKKIDDLAVIQKRSRSEIIRHAIDKYLKSHGADYDRENLLESRMRKLEKRLADLTVLSTRASAQTLYYMTLPYSRGGFPTRPLK